MSDVVRLSPSQLARGMDANLERRFIFETGEWSAEKSAVLATRPYPLELTLCGDPRDYHHFLLEDKGTAFVDALERRQSPFGSLCINFEDIENFWIPFSPENLMRLLNLDFLTLSMVYDHLALLPFSALTNALDYEFDANFFEEADFDNLNILTQDLAITMNDDYNDNWDRRLVSFVNRLAALGHFTRLRISVSCREELVPERVDAIVAAFVAVISGNPNLTYLNLSESDRRFDWNLQLRHIVRVAEQHRGLRELVLEAGGHLVTPALFFVVT